MHHPAFCYVRDYMLTYRACLEASVTPCQTNNSIPHAIEKAQCVAETTMRVPIPVSLDPACTGG